MVAGVCASVFTHDGAIFCSDGRRQGPRIAQLSTDEVSFGNGLQPTRPCTKAEHLAQATNDWRVELFSRERCGPSSFDRESAHTKSVWNPLNAGVPVSAKRREYDGTSVTNLCRAQLSPSNPVSSRVLTQPDTPGGVVLRGGCGASLAVEVHPDRHLDLFATPFGSDEGGPRCWTVDEHRDSV